MDDVIIPSRILQLMDVHIGGMLAGCDEKFSFEK
jgi:hypothetical protein